MCLSTTLKDLLKCIAVFCSNNECLILHHKAFRTDYISRSTKIDAPSAAEILVLREFK